MPRRSGGAPSSSSVEVQGRLAPRSYPVVDLRHAGSSTRDPDVRVESCHPVRPYVMSAVGAQSDDETTHDASKEGIHTPVDEPICFSDCIRTEKRGRFTDVRGMSPSCLNEIHAKSPDPLLFVDVRSSINSGTVGFFKKINLQSGFLMRYGHYEFLVMPFGLMNTPTTFKYHESV